MNRATPAKPIMHIASAILILFAAITASRPPSAELGGLLTLAGGSASPLELSSYSWERGDWGKGGRGNKFIAFGRVGAPDKGPGVLVVVTPVAMTANPLRALCGKGSVGEVSFRSPDIDDPTLRTFEIFTLNDVTVSDCVHADGAPGEVFHLNFAKVTELTPPHPTCVFGKDC